MARSRRTLHRAQPRLLAVGRGREAVVRGRPSSSDDGELARPGQRGRSQIGPSRPRSTRWGQADRARQARRRARGLVRALIGGLVVFIAGAYGLAYWHLVQIRRQIEATRMQYERIALEREKLRQEVQRWQDPQVIEEAAREQLGLVMPGEQRFVVAEPLPANDPFRVDKRAKQGSALD
ncbi:MAG: septum formation initiator family protein [Limnochordaceae bacterium]|nr:septum formation initiator family protein [Limnochordaceae bacterium]